MHWTSIIPTGFFWPSPRSGVSVCQKDGIAYFFGGYTRKGHCNDLFYYNTGSTTSLRLVNVFIR